MDDKPQDHGQDPRVAGAGPSGHQRRPQSSGEDLVGAVQRKIGEAAGELTNNLVGAAAHVDIAHRFADPITPALARQYVKGRALIEQRKASGIADGDMSGLSGADAAAIIAYQKVHDSLPAQIPLIDKATLLRHAEEIIEQKANKAAPPPEAPRAARPARAINDDKTQADVKKPYVQASKVEKAQKAQKAQKGIDGDGDGEGKGENASRAQNSGQIKGKVEANRGTRPESHEQPHNVQRAEPKTAQKFEQKAEKLNEARTRVEPDQRSDHSSDQRSDQKAEPQSRLNSSARSSSESSPRSSLESLRGACDAPGQSFQLREGKLSKQSEESGKAPPKPHEPASPILKSIGNRQAAVTHEQAADTSHGKDFKDQLEAKQKLPLSLIKSAARDAFIPVVQSRFYAALTSTSVKSVSFVREFSSSPQRQLAANQTSQQASERASRDRFHGTFHDASHGASGIVSKQRFSIPLAMPLLRQNALSRAFPQVNAKQTESENSTVRKQSEVTHHIDSTTKAASTARHDVHMVEQPTKISADHPGMQHAEHSSGHKSEPQTEGLTEFKSELNSKLNSELNSELKSAHFSDHSANHIAGHPFEKPHANTNKSLKFTLKGATDKDESGDKYITGTEFAFVAIMALASTARAKPGPNTAEEGLRQAQRQFTMVEENIWPTKASDEQQQLTQAPPAPPARKSDPMVKMQTVLRPQILVQSGDDLSEMAASLFHDERLGHLIADLNADKTSQTFEQNARVVVIRTRQKLTLPAYKDIVDYAQKLVKIGEIPLITVVETNAIDQELLDDRLSPMLGIKSPNRDPLQS